MRTAVSNYSYDLGIKGQGQIYLHVHLPIWLGMRIPFTVFDTRWFICCTVIAYGVLMIQNVPNVSNNQHDMRVKGQIYITTRLYGLQYQLFLQFLALCIYLYSPAFKMCGYTGPWFRPPVIPSVIISFGTVTCHFSQICNRGMARFWYQNFISAQYLENKWIELHQIIYKTCTRTCKHLYQQ